MNEHIVHFVPEFILSIAVLWNSWKCNVTQEIINVASSRILKIQCLINTGETELNQDKQDDEKMVYSAVEALEKLFVESLSKGLQSVLTDANEKAFDTGTEFHNIFFCNISNPPKCISFRFQECRNSISFKRWVFITWYLNSTYVELTCFVSVVSSTKYFLHRSNNACMLW